MKSFYRGHHWNLDTDFMPERAGFTRPCCFHLGYPGLWWPNPNSILSLVCRIRMNCGSVGQMMCIVNRKLYLNLIRRWIGHWAGISLCFDLNKNRGFSCCTCSQGPLLMEGGAWKVEFHSIQSRSLTHRSKTLHTCAHTYSIYSTSSMLLVTQVQTDFLICYAFLRVPSWFCVNSLTWCQKMCQECIKRLRL